MILIVLERFTVLRYCYTEKIESNTPQPCIILYGSDGNSNSSSRDWPLNKKEPDSLMNLAL